MNTLVAKFYLWTERIKSLYAAGGTLIAVLASVLLVAVGLPLQISGHGGSWYIVTISGLAGALITTLIENLTVKGCAALRRIHESIKAAKLKNAELKAHTLLELEQQGLATQLPVAIKEAMDEAMDEAKKGQFGAHVFIGLGVLASIAGNGLFWDAVLGSLPLIDIVGVTAIFSFVIPTILIDSEIRSGLHKAIIQEGMNSALDVTTAAQNADARVLLHQRLHDEQQEHLGLSSTKTVLQEAAASNMDGLLEEILGKEGIARQYRTRSGRTGVIEARALQQLSSNAPLLYLPAPAAVSDQQLVLTQLTSALQALSQPQTAKPEGAPSAEVTEPERTSVPLMQQFTEEQLATLIEAGVQKALAAQQADVSLLSTKEDGDEKEEDRQSGTAEVGRFPVSGKGKKKKLLFEDHRALILQLLQEVEMLDDVRVSKVEEQTGAARSTAHRWLVRAKRELEQARLSEQGQADVSLGGEEVMEDSEQGQADVSSHVQPLRIVRS